MSTERVIAPYGRGYNMDYDTHEHDWRTERSACPQCGREDLAFSDEGDCLCPVHEFVSPVWLGPKA